MYFKRDIHVGDMIKEVFDQTDLSVVDFAKLLKCQRQNIYDIFARDSIDVKLLVRISRVLNHDFLAEFYNDEEDKKPEPQKIALTLTFDYDGLSCENVTANTVHIISREEINE